MSLFGKLGGFLGNPGKLFGTNDLIGEALNDVTGVTSSARQQYQYNNALQNNAQNFNAQQAQIERDWQNQMSNTARQRAVSDLQSAGLNPVLAAGAEASSGAGAAATSPGGSTGAGVGTNPISMITELINAVNNTARTNADIKNNTKITKAKINNLEADTKNKKQDYDINEPDEETSKALKWWNSTWLGKGLSVAGQTIKQISPFVDTATNVSKANSARRISKSKKFK